MSRGAEESKHPALRYREGRFGLNSSAPSNQALINGPDTRLALDRIVPGCQWHALSRGGCWGGERSELDGRWRGALVARRWRSPWRYRRGMAADALRGRVFDSERIQVLVGQEQLACNTAAPSAADGAHDDPLGIGCQDDNGAERAGWDAARGLAPVGEELYGADEALGGLPEGFGHGREDGV